MQRLRCGGKSAQIGNGDEGVELVKVELAHGPSLTIRKAEQLPQNIQLFK